MPTDWKLFQEEIENFALTIGIFEFGINLKHPVITHVQKTTEDIVKEMLSEEILLSVSKPGRYIGNERNSVHKDHREVKLKVALVFPDVYEVGMSYPGLKILYSILNSRPDIVCERCFAPWIDMEKVMRARGIPLTSLESRTPLREFDIVGITLNSEMNYTNVLNMFDLAGIEKKNTDRKIPPLVIAGGTCCFNPEPMSLFFDLFCIGEGEEVILEIAERFLEVKKHAGRKRDKLFREEMLEAMARIEGVYVPSYYRVNYAENGLVKEVIPVKRDVPSRVRKRTVLDFTRAPIPCSPVVPFIEVVHDRMTVEIMRGCANGCRFCQAGIIYRPRRERRICDIMNAARNTFRSTGYEEIALLSLSCADYSRIIRLIELLHEEYGRKGVNISLPSLRVKKGLEFLPPLLRKVRKSGLTFAPEAGTERLRRVINKDIDVEELLKAAACAWREGWRKLKLYFMIGLPTEKDIDLDGIVNLSLAVSEANRGIKGFAGEVAVSIASFVPKPHSVFQWEGMADSQTLAQKQDYLKKKIRNRKLRLSLTDIEAGLIEAALSRGDRRMGEVILRAWEGGARFDGWSDCFSAEFWADAFRDCGLSAAFYANRHRDFDEFLPWEHVDTGVHRHFLIAEREKAGNAETTPSCQYEGCRGCGICGS